MPMMFVDFWKGKIPSLVREGDGGFRLSYDQSTDSLRVIFTQGFENPDEPNRKIIEEWLRDNFADIAVN